MPDTNRRPLPPAESFVMKEHFTVAELLDLMAFLRSDQGCPWDREQTHRSLRQNLLEEAYEVIDAIESGKPDRLCDELGDVLMQVVFHAQMAQEAGAFTFSDVVAAICNKLISRHTHIFGPDRAATPDAVIANWEKNKKREKGLDSQTQVLLDVPRAVPALQRSYKVQQKAAQVGFDWDKADGPRQKIEEELAEIKEASNQDHLEDELGDLLFSVVNYARHLKVQPEMALNRSTEKFIRRFAALEARAEASNLKLGALSLSEMDRLWDDVKQDEKGGKSDASR
ncbi:MAG: nucleoside triphosphate pyrophosphohydrolase [Clostridiaceae bacterium]|nr:nucleoside triphosphate pyrophosphohydrolase [Clostridiaceae bacterium]